MAQVDGFGDIVCHKQHGGLGLIDDLEEQVVEFGSQHVIESCEGFVEQQDVWVGDQCARDRGSHFHTAGELVGFFVPVVGFESDQIQCVLDPGFDIGVRVLFPDFPGETNVLIDRSPGQQRGFLEDESELVLGFRDALAFDSKGSGVGFGKPRDDS